MKTKLLALCFGLLIFCNALEAKVHTIYAKAMVKEEIANKLYGKIDNADKKTKKEMFEPINYHMSLNPIPLKRKFPRSKQQEKRDKVVAEEVEPKLFDYMDQLEKLDFKIRKYSPDFSGFGVFEIHSSKDSELKYMLEGSPHVSVIRTDDAKMREGLKDYFSKDLLSTNIQFDVVCASPRIGVIVSCVSYKWCQKKGHIE